MICPKPSPSTSDKPFTLFGRAPPVQVQEVLQVTRDNLLEELVIGEGVEEEDEPILDLEKVLYASDTIGLLALFIYCMGNQSLALLSQVPEIIKIKFIIISIRFVQILDTEGTLGTTFSRQL